MWAYFGHETSGFVVSEQTGGGGSVCFPWLAVWRYFYSKADCTVSGCLYTISTIMEEEQPLPHAHPLCDDPSLPASLWLFFLFVTQTDCFSPGVFQYRPAQFVFDCSIHLPDSFIVSMVVDAYVGNQRCVFGHIYTRINEYVVKFVRVHWRHAVCVCNPFWLQPVTRILQEEMAECGRRSLMSHMGFCLGCRKLWNYGWRVLHQTL